MLSKFNKIISIILTMVFITGIFPPVVFAQPSPASLGEVKGFNKTVIDSHFSRADREINPERWLAEAKFGVTQAICAWELIAGSLYENPLLYEEAKAQIIKWSDEELEKRFSQWLMGRFFGKAAEEALINLSSMFNESQKYYSWHLDEEGNVIFDDKTGDPLVIRPNEEGREFSSDLTFWRNEADGIVKTTGASFNNAMISLCPELLAYIPSESRESISAIINETINVQSNVIKREFENIAAREERIFTNRRTRDIWSLRKKSDDEAAKIFTEKLIAETEDSCKNGIEELNSKIEQASAGAGDLALLGEEWLRLYKEQFERGLKAWEDAEERFFIRRIEWEQESFKLFSEGETVWLSAFNQFEEERQKWELNAKELFQAGESLFKNISEDFERNIADAKKEFELNITIRIGEGTNRVKALIDMYFVCTSAAISSIDNIKFWQNQYGNSEKNIRDSDFSDWILKETKNLWKQTRSAYLNDPEYISDCEKLAALEYLNGLMPYSLASFFLTITYAQKYGSTDYNEYLIEFNKKYSKLFQVQEFLKGEMALSDQIVLAKNMDSRYFPIYKFESLVEMQTSYDIYLLYAEKSLDARDKIYENYAELFGTGALKDILSSDVSSDDFYLDEYQIALIRAKALVLYWERKTSIAEAVTAYAGELSAGRMTETEGLRAWEEAKAAYNKSLAVYETELSKLNKTGEDIQKQQEILHNITVQMQKEEEILNNLQSEYSSIMSMSVINLMDYYSADFNEKYNSLVEKYKKYQKTGVNSVYFSALKNGLLWEIAEQRETAEIIINIFETNDDLSEEEITALYNNLIALSPEFRNELWKNICDSLSLLFNDYGLKTEINKLPDAQSICLAIFSRPGDFAENTAKFLADFDNCFPTVHAWMQYEIDNWKDSLIEYITTFAFFYNIQPMKNTAELANLYDDLLSEYNDFYQYAITYDPAAVDDDITDQMNNAFKEINNKFKMFDYSYRISESWQAMNLISSTENETNWRQYLFDSYITNKDPALVMVSSWKAGILADALYYVSYCTNRLNDSFNIYSQRDKYNTYENAEQLYDLYSEEISQILFDFNLLNSQYNEITNAARLLGFSKLSSNDIKDQLSSTEEAIKNQEETLNLIRNKYYKEAEIFLNIGLQYDNQYNILKIAYNNADQKRFEYEKQDAIQKWASTSYTNTDNIDPESCKANLLKAQTVLNVLSDISNNTNGASNNNPEYEALYTAYEQSFTRKFKALEAIEMLSSAYMQERMNNENIHNQYQNSLFHLGINFDYDKYNLPASKSEWNIENIITIKDGRLAFSKDESMKIIGVNSTEAMTVIDFFNKTESVNSEYIDITGYEEALRGLSQRMSEYFKDQNKFMQWSYARNYLISSLINANGDLSFLKSYLSLAEELGANGSLASENVKRDILRRSTTLYSEMEYSLKHNFQKTIPGILISSFIPNTTEDAFRTEWNKLSAEEKADLEFYVILTLTTGRDYFAGFSKMYTYKAYEHAYNLTYNLYSNAQDKMDTWYLFLEHLAWKEVRDINKSTNNRIKPGYQAMTNSVNEWINGLNNNLKSIKNLTTLYAASCQKLEKLEGIKPEDSKIVWSDLESALLISKMKSEDIAVLKNCWETMQKNAGNTVYQNIFDALIALSNWTDSEVYYAKSNLETRLSTDMKNKQANEVIFLSAIDDYFKGTANIKTVKTAAENAYGKNSISAIYHLDNTYGILINNLSLYTTTDFNLNRLFNDKKEEIISLTANTIFNKYNAELTAREAEWELMKKDITEKYNEWQSIAAQIFENGRTDWTESYKKLEDAYKQWNLNFQSEYERVNEEWAQAYLAGLEDKEKWLQQAADAADQASSESFLSLIGAEGERLSRFMDTREPLGIRDTVPQAQALMTGLLQSSGIVNMANAFNSLNSFTNITSPLVKRGMGGSSTWDSALVKIAASDLARKTNAEIAKSESRKIAYSAHISADEAVKNLINTVNTANQNFRENMDNIFIFKGLWRKNGNDYVKDIIKGSTVFTPVISKTVSITGYKNYTMEPVTLKTNLDDNYLAGLETIAIQGLINNVYIEVQTIAGEIFGDGQAAEKIDDDREQSPGKFGAHIGYSPAQKELKEATTNRKEMFYDEGAGELGRLMSDFQYWNIIDKIGSAELALAPWDKRLWNDEGSWFAAPSIRSIGVIAGSIAAGIITGGTGFAGIALYVGLSSASEVALGVLDVSYGYKSLDEAAFSVGKTVLTNTATSLLGGAFEGLTNTAMSKAAPGFDKIFTKTLMTGTQTLTTGTATSLISGITYNSTNGFGYSAENFNAGMKGTLTSSLVSMASIFTSTSLTAISSGLDFSKVVGFNKLNISDLQNLNGLIGSLAGQGVNYALGNDFTLNLLNLSLLPNSDYNSGLLELHLGRDGVKMNIGTGGANVSIDNLISAYKGAQVWNVNTKISKYGEKNNFDALIALRAQYGYGDNVQKEQLWDILNGDALINTNVKGEYFAETTINEDRKRVINLTGYEKGMSIEDQYFLGVVLGYEAYRDGYSVGEIDANGNLVTSWTQTYEFRTASIAKLMMADRIQEENKWFYNEFEELAGESSLLRASKLTNDYSLFNDYLELTYNNDRDYLCISTDNKGNFQNNSDYIDTPLFKALTLERVNEINNKRIRDAYKLYNMPVFSYDKYISYQEYLNSPEYKIYEGRLKAGDFEPENSEARFNEFKKNKELLEKYQYNEVKFISIYNSGCTFMSTKYAIEAITGKEVNTLDLHEFIMKNNHIIPGTYSLLSNELLATIMTTYTDNEYTVTYMKDLSTNPTATRNPTYTPTIDTLNKIKSPGEEYVIHLRIKDPSNPNEGSHSVTVKSIEYTYDNNGKITGISKINVANPYDGRDYFGRESYSPSQVYRWDIYLVTQNKKQNSQEDI